MHMLYSTALLLFIPTTIATIKIVIEICLQIVNTLAFSQKMSKMRWDADVDAQTHLFFLFNKYLLLKIFFFDNVF